MVKRKHSTTQPKAQSQPISGAKEMTLPISALRLDFQPQDKYPLQEEEEEGVQDFVDRLRRGEIPPPVLVRFDGTNYFLENGFHRVEAMKRLHKRRIKVIVRPGTLADLEAEWREAMRRLNEALKLPVQT